ncbi:MAG: hypothetical protein QOI36_5367 [Pseudonocardiales bacterium]|jgi:hypothetical protein|nr:conserved rane protein of unknown function [Pseudonocardia sp.]MDT7653961.1 hypothetical protein [Pseudonocardiales bacterium]
MDPSNAFYQSLTGTSFTLLGLWFAVVQFAHGGWRTDPERHATAMHLTLKFFLPGTLGLASLLASVNDGGLIWRISFALGGLIGLVESVRYLRSSGGTAGRVTVRTLSLADPLLYGFVAAAAFVPPGITRLTPLQIEGIATGLVFISGLCGVWVAFSERARVESTDRRGDPHRSR